MKDEQECINRKKMLMLLSITIWNNKNYFRRHPLLKPNIFIMCIYLNYTIHNYNLRYQVSQKVTAFKIIIRKHLYALFQFLIFLSQSPFFRST